MVNSHLLYQLSYRGILAIVPLFFAEVNPCNYMSPIIVDIFIIPSVQLPIISIRGLWDWSSSEESYLAFIKIFLAEPLDLSVHTSDLY